MFYAVLLVVKSGFARHFLKQFMLQRRAVALFDIEGGVYDGRKALEDVRFEVENSGLFLSSNERLLIADF